MSTKIKTSNRKKSAANAPEAGGPGIGAEEKIRPGKTVNRGEKLVDPLQDSFRYILSLQGKNPDLESVRAAMESTCYAVRANCEILEDVSGRPLEALRLVGGQSRSPLWVQMQSDILQKPIILPGVAEASGWGAAICAGIGVGIWSTPTDVEISVSARVVAPQRENSQVYEALYQAWRRQW